MKRERSTSNQLQRKTRRFFLECLETRSNATLVPEGALLQPFVNNAAPQAVLHLAPGAEYAGPVSITRPITIIGNGAKVVSPNATAFTIANARGVSLQGIEVTGFGQGVLDGGAITAINSVVYVSNSVFSNNNARSLGAVVARDNSNLVLTNSTFFNSNADARGIVSNAEGGQGALVTFTGGSTGLFASNGSTNSSVWWEGAILVGAVIRGGYVLSGPAGAVQVIDNVLENLTGNRHAGILIVDGQNGTVISNNTIIRPTSNYQSASGIAVISGEAEVVNNTIIGTAAPAGQSSAGIVFGAHATGEVYNNIVTSGEVGIEAPAAVDAHHNLLFGQPTPVAGGVTAGVETIYADPGLVPDEAGGYQLAANSPARGSGAAIHGVAVNLGALAEPMTMSLNPSTKAMLQQTLIPATRYFTSPNMNNMTTGMPNAWGGGTGTMRYFDSDAGRWIETPTKRGFGSHVNVSELGFALLVRGIAYENGYESYENTIGLNIKLLRTLRSMQTSGDPRKFNNGNFPRAILTTIWENGADRDRTVDETMSDGNNTQASDDGALLWGHLRQYTDQTRNAQRALPDQDETIALTTALMKGIDLRRFVIDGKIVHELKNGVPSALHWNRASVEGGMILPIMVAAHAITVPEFNELKKTLVVGAVDWPLSSGGTISIVAPNYHAASFMPGLFGIHGFPISGTDVAGSNFYVKHSLPSTTAQVDYAMANGLTALGSQAMTQAFAGVPVFERVENGTRVQVQYPGNESGIPPSPDELGHATGSHANIIPLQRWRELSPDTVATLQQMLEINSEYFHSESFGWEAVIPFQHEAPKGWRDADGNFHITDGGETFELLNSAYIFFAAWDALNPDSTLAHMNPLRDQLAAAQVAIFENRPLLEDLFRPAFRNALNAYDVNEDGKEDITDLLAVIFSFNHAFGPLPVVRSPGSPFVDVNGDAMMNIADILAMIYRHNQLTDRSAAAGESVSSADAPDPVPLDELYYLFGLESDTEENR